MLSSLRIVPRMSPGPASVTPGFPRNQQKRINENKTADNTVIYRTTVGAHTACRKRSQDAEPSQHTSLPKRQPGVLLGTLSL